MLRPSNSKLILLHPRSAMPTVPRIQLFAALSALSLLKMPRARSQSGADGTLDFGVCIWLWRTKLITVSLGTRSQLPAARTQLLLALRGTLTLQNIRLDAKSQLERHALSVMSVQLSVACAGMLMPGRLLEGGSNLGGAALRGMAAASLCI